MQYMLLIYDNEKAWADLAQGEQEKLFGEYMEFTQNIVKSGHFRAGDALQPVSTATTVTVKEGKVLTTDGPFAETKEQLLGFVMLEAESLDEALKIAGDIPIAEWGTIEVRAVYDVPDR
jgi:hypothetical protein